MVLHGFLASVVALSAPTRYDDQMTNTSDNDDVSRWEASVAAIWHDYRSGRLPDEALVEAIDAAAAQRHPNDAVALFERAGARDSVGLELEAEPLYRAAIANGLDGARRPQAIIQLASTLRLLGRLDESDSLLRGMIESPGKSNTLIDEARFFLALTLEAKSDPRQALGYALQALAPHLSRYNRSAAAYATELLQRARGDR